MSVPGPIREIAVASGTAVAGRKAAAQGSEPVRLLRAEVPAETAPVKVAAAPREDARELSARIAERLQNYLKDSGRDVEYRVDADAGATVITVRRSDTGEVVRQFPSEEALAWLQRLNEQSGTFLDALA